MEDEFAFISRISPNETKQHTLICGIGDDAAVYRSSSHMDEVICVDTMVEGVHFRRDTLSPFQIGKKGLAINISDLAAMGAIPAFYLVSIAIPPTWSESELMDIYKGMESVAKPFNMDLIGGDTVSISESLVLTVTVIGRVEQGQAKYRNQAKAGDVLFVTGYVGTSAAGLNLLLEKGLDGDFTEHEKKLITFHQEPSPHVKEGRLLLQATKRVALNDVSDGVASEANELAEASQARIIIDSEKLPIHESMKEFSRTQQLNWALFGGEDFVLIGTIAKERADQIAKQFSEHNARFHVIGFVEEGETGVFLKEGNAIKKLEKHGYNHFQKRG
ncbi:thiamine-phosphate kinase [Halalkalibacter akibai]|uniref:Thiamine-monophosphate kinase n=1 Tax=Halalkalibacter akibai (strain ATCC 43226 / DSM 21942 / CIP 109018 / JCM 9157 / 1139) TaxID=1236973 RepID=W4QYW7_HALA3|nr:thiamine-phosphate kinase [Halalkalibacter akibai]GAE37271.1 thiamine-monophosphate kinase [Halalkalibacter akibai JCM 9157]